MCVGEYEPSRGLTSARSLGRHWGTGCRKNGEAQTWAAGVAHACNTPRAAEAGPATSALAALVPFRGGGQAFQRVKHQPRSLAAAGWTLRLGATPAEWQLLAPLGCRSPRSLPGSLVIFLGRSARHQGLAAGAPSGSRGRPTQFSARALASLISCGFDGTPRCHLCPRQTPACDNGGEHEVVQGEGGEQGDPLMPAPYSLAQHAALSEAAAGLREGEAIFAFLDDTYVVSAPERTGELHGALEDALWRHARLRLHQGKTRVWNAAGEEPSGLARLQPVAADPVWTGAWSLPADQRGLLVLGAPLGIRVKLSCAVSLAANAWSKTSCSAVSLLSAICSPRGSSCCFVPRRVPTIGCCRPARRKPSHASTTPPSVLA
eukprot:s2597_g1.t1